MKLVAKVPVSESSIEYSFPGAKVPASETARVLLELSLQGANWPGSRKARYLDRYVYIGIATYRYDSASYILL